MCIRDSAQQSAGNNGGAHGRHWAKAQLVHNEPGHVCTHHDDIAVGKVQQQDDAVHLSLIHICHAFQSRIADSSYME